jgi:protein-S-isoprenylcysteine O-methyltransferase
VVPAGRTGSSAAVRLAGGALHLLILAAPLIALGRADRMIGDPPVVLILLLATGFYVGETSVLRSEGDPAPRGVSASRTRAQRLALATGAAILGIFWAALGERAARGTVGSSVLSTAGGALLMTGGVLLRVLAIRSLGLRFVTELAPAPDRPLVQSGAYRFVRHPSETGTLAIALGACALLESPAGLAIWLVALLPLVLRRVSEEDRYLAAARSREFRLHAARARRLVPFIY